MNLPQIDPLRAAVESVLLVIDTPVTPMDLARALDVEPAAIREVLAQMRDEFDANEGTDSLSFSSERVKEWQ